ncbi:hypothetical protein ACIA5G_34230 [Amycolatopsis sp. NPDC051758]|uniref:hypothetical protein n=1 Tax=Amycolatopsis sp. NPDC051758 TaxID=3363935 RepID=UPI0037886C8A
MKTISGRLAEARLYLFYVYAVLRPGIRVPTFTSPPDGETTMVGLSVEDLKLVLEEGRRALDQQEINLERIRSRASTSLTLGLAEIAALSALAPRAFAKGPVITILWCVGAVAVILGIGGAVAVLTAQAIMGSINPRQVAATSSPVLPHLVQELLRSLGESEVTVRTRLTVFRDAILLETVSALLLGGIWPFTR